MTPGSFLAVITDSVIEKNPAVTAELKTEDGRIRRAKFFTDREEALVWCERMNRLGKKELVLIPAEDSADADVKVVDKSEPVTQLSSDDENDEEGDFEDFFNDTF